MLSTAVQNLNPFILKLQMFLALMLLEMEVKTQRFMYLMERN